jgi:tetratricopeptide (TPR) repeat protein
VAQVLAARAPTWLAQFPSFVAPEQREGLQRDIVGSTRDRMVRELCEGVEALATETPLVFILEDLHWVDLATLDVLSALARRRGPVRLVVVATYRPDDVSASNPLKGLKQDLLVHQLCDEIALDPLAEADVAEYLAAEFPGAAVPGLASLIHRHSGGSPLFMVGIVQDMVKKAQLAWDHDRGWTLAACVEDISPAVPDSLQQMLEVQFGQLSSAEQRILEHASVMGERFSVWAITTPADLSAEHIENACEGLAERRQFIRSTGLRELTDRSISAHYEFRHSLFRQAVYESLSGVHRARLHRTVGERLAALCTPEHPEAAGEVAGHFEAAREYGRAIDYLVQSADNAVRRFAYRESIQTLGRALALVPRMSSGIAAGVEVQLRERIGDAHYWFGAMAASAREYEAAATLAANAGLASARARLLSGLVRPLGLIDPDRGIAAVEAAERLSATLPGALQHEHVRFLAAGSRLMYDTWRHDDWEICASAREAIQRLSVAGLPAYHRVIYGHLQVLQGHYAEALEHLDVGIPSSEEPTSLMAYFFAHSGRTLALLHSGQFGELLHIIRAETDKAEKNGSDPWLFSFREAWLRTAVLDFDGARQLCDRLTGVSPEAPLGQPRTIARFSAGCTALALRRYDVARRQFEEILDPQITPKFFLHWHWRMKARLGLSNAWLAAGELERAGEEANQFSESVASTAEPNLQTLACEVQARVAMAARDLTGAADHIQRAVAIVESFDIPTYAWRVHATCAELYRRLKDEKSADRHRKRAEAVIGSLAGSFALNEPLRRSFLAAPEIERIRHASMPRTGARGRGSSHSAHHASD